MDYQQKNPLKYYALPFLFEFFNNVHQGSKNNFLLLGATKWKSQYSPLAAE